MNIYIHYSEYDYAKERPTLVIQGDYSSSGYDLDKDTGEIIRQVCLCAARDPSECCCTYDWQDEGSI